jgi:predicted glycosyltransferase
MSKELLEDLSASPGAVSQPSGTGVVSAHGTQPRATGSEGKIWIDIDNSPHVPFFIPIIEELRKRGFEVMLTARDLYQVCELLEFFHLDCKVIGGSYGKNRIMKVLGNCYRAGQLVPLAMREKPTLSVSHGSRGQILASKALGIPTVLMHDYEHSTKTGFLEASWVITPDVIPDNSMTKKNNRTMKYPGLKEDVYIPRLRPDSSIYQQLGVSATDFLVTLRPPATEAHYHNPEAEALFDATLRLLAKHPEVRAVTLPRNQRQADELRAKWPELLASRRMIIPDSPVDGLNLIWFSELVVSGGGTMNREAAALNVPVYSVFRGKIGAVDRYLAASGRLTMIEKVEEVSTKIKLVRRQKPLNVEESRPETLQAIVDSIVRIGELQSGS